MNLQNISRNQAFALLGKKAVLASSTRRLSRRLTVLYSQFQQEQNCPVWETPSVMPFNSWLESAFYSIKDEDKPFLLSTEQEESLWEEIISSASPEHRFLWPAGMSETAAKAFEIMAGYKLPWSEIDNSPDREIKAFAFWAGLFRQKCSEKKFLARAGLPGFMTGSLERSLFSPPQTLILAGFYEFEPAVVEFLSALAENHVQLYVLEHAVPHANVSRTVFNDFKYEAGTAARWALNLVLENPEARVGVVVPGLETLRSRLVRIFDHVFHPETIMDFCEPEKRKFNVSLGSPLSRYPLVRSAVVFLGLLIKNRWDMIELEVILGSPFISGEREEFAARAALEEKVSREAQPWVSAQTVLEAAGREGKPYHCPVLTRILSQAREMLPSRETFQSPAGWAKLFSKLLASAGWPDPRGLNSFEHQTFQAFKEELSRLSGLESVLEDITCSQALEKLNSLLGSRVFQPAAPKAGMQVLGLFETAGLDFDHLWVMNFNADVLPAPCKPNPLLPVDLQIKFKTPGSSPARELELASRIMNSLLGSSGETIFSHSTHEDDREVMASPFIEGMGLTDPADIPVKQALDIFSLLSQSPGLAEITDDHGLPLEDAWLPGGARAFQDQALCPFKGYAVHRLGAAAPQEPVFALSPADRGSLVHKVLMRVWQEIGSLEELREMIHEDALDSLIDETALLTVREFQGRGHVLFTPEFMSLEQKRLRTIIRQWLDKELDRSWFEVSALEKTEYVVINGIRIKTRMDRLDRLENGRMIIIDYKTGAGIGSVESMWMGDRIIEPQLPIYSLIAGPETSGVVLAQVNPRTFRFHGIIEGDEISFKGNSLKTPQKLNMPAIKDIIEQWTEKLEAISREIKEGLALVDPLPQSGDKTCKYCDFKALCRVMEQAP